VPAGAFGPQLEAAVATLSVRNRISRRDLVELSEELFGCALATGTVDAIVQRTGQALAVAYEDLLGQVRRAPAVNVDETGWRLRGKQRTLWGAFTEGAAVFRIAPRPPPAGGRRAPGRGVRRHRLLGSLVGLQRARSRPPPGLLVASRP
jgi:hypothetical protein